MNYQHRNLAKGKWRKLSFFEQMANIGSEIERAIKWRNINPEYYEISFQRALELLDLSVEDKKNRSRLREILRVREALIDYFMYDNIYGSSDEKWRNYFYAFSFAARLNINK
jgi:hypothetical protein